MVQLDDPARWEEALGSSSSTGEDANIKHQTRLDESDGGPFVADIIPSRAVTDGGGPPFIIPSRPSPIVAGHPSASPSRSAIDDSGSPRDHPRVTLRSPSTSVIDDGGSPFEICNR